MSKLLETWTVGGGPFWRTAQLIPLDAPIRGDPKWMADREEMSGRKWDGEAMKQGRPEAMAHMRMFTGTVEETLLGRGREWVLGGREPTVADVNVV